MNNTIALDDIRGFFYLIYTTSPCIASFTKRVTLWCRKSGKN